MGGEGPYVKFDGKCCTKRDLGALNAVDNQHLNEAYTRAHGFLLDNARKLVDLGWKQQETDDSLLVSLDITSSWRRTTAYYNAPGVERTFQRQLQLPRNVSAFFESSSNQKWEKMFEPSSLFHAHRERGWSSSDSGSDRYGAYLYPDVEDPLRDIFYMLQCLIPGMLSIIRIDEIDDIREDEIFQTFPPTTWMEDYSRDIRRILGDQRFEEVKQAPSCFSRVVSSVWEPDDNDDGEVLDYTACDTECGYCGRCRY